MNFLKKFLFHFAYNYKIKWNQKGFRTPMVDNIIFKPIKNIVGGKLRTIVTGGAPLTTKTQELVRTWHVAPSQEVN